MTSKSYLTLLYFFKKSYCKNGRANINQNFMNILKTYLGWESVKNVFTSLFLCVWEVWINVKEMENCGLTGKLIQMI